MSLIERLYSEGIIKNDSIKRAFDNIKRYDFLTAPGRDYFETDAPISIGYGQTNSQPTTVALMLGWLSPEKGDKILDVGCGSGWTTALLAEIAGPEGKVFGLEIVRELVRFAEENIAKYDFIKKGIVQIFCTDGYSGLPEFSPFDRILVSAAAQAIPEALKQQLRIGGRMVIPVGCQGDIQDIVIIDKQAENKFLEKRIPGFAFVPLIWPAASKS